MAATWPASPSGTPISPPDWRSASLKVEKALKGSDVPSGILQRATFEAWGKAISPRRTMQDWLSHDPAAVDAFIADPLCGFAPTLSMMEDVMALIFQGGSEAGLAMLPAELPVHCLGGTADPATDKGEAVTVLAGRLRLAGVRDVTLQIVEGARHETLNEVPLYRDPALAGLFAWFDRIVPAGDTAPRPACAHAVCALPLAGAHARRILLCL
mgnify:CR=1 FL=1